MLGIVLTAGIADAIGQERRADKKAVEGFEKAKLLVQRNRLAEALQVLQKAIGYDSCCAELYFLKADIYNKQKDTLQEKEAMEKGLALDSVNYPMYYFYLGENYRKNGGYQKALVNYSAYLRKDKKKVKASWVQRQMENCEFALHAMETQKKQAVELFMETPEDTYWPCWDVSGQTVLYTTQHKETENIWMRRDSIDYFLNINTWHNEGTQTLTADGQMMFFTGCGRPDSRGSCDIYVAYRISDTLWSVPMNLGEPINTDAWEAQPSVSPDGTKLFFASTRSGGRGGSDIWYSTLLSREENGRQHWSKPQLLYFNTSGNEMAPYLHYDGKTLFFASDGYPGMGGMDIYKVNLENKDVPVNIGITVNTYRNEMGFVVDASGRKGYFASDAGGKKKIYRYDLEDQMVCEEVTYLKLDVKDEGGRRIQPDFLIVQSLLDGDTLAYYDRGYMPADLMACLPAHALVLISVLKKGYLYYSDTLQMQLATFASPLRREVVLQPIRSGNVWVLKGIFFDVGDYHLRPESEAELQQLVYFLRQNPETKIEIAGYTDNSGEKEYNDRLSENRAFEVYKYLFMNRISKERMVYKGYGEAYPVASNETEAGKAMNRRTEIKIK